MYTKIAQYENVKKISLLEVSIRTLRGWSKKVGFQLKNHHQTLFFVFIECTLYMVCTCFHNCTYLKGDARPESSNQPFPFPSQRRRQKNISPSI